VKLLTAAPQHRYCVLIADIYGVDVTSQADAYDLYVANVSDFLSRIELAVLEPTKAQRDVFPMDADKIVLVGFCFGGTGERHRFSLGVFFKIGSCERCGAADAAWRRLLTPARLAFIFQTPHWRTVAPLGRVHLSVRANLMLKRATPGACLRRRDRLCVEWQLQRRGSRDQVQLVVRYAWSKGSLILWLPSLSLDPHHVFSFHGGLDNRVPLTASTISAKLAIFSGGVDASADEDSTHALATELERTHPPRKWWGVGVAPWQASALSIPGPSTSRSRGSWRGP
jgi:dienelactone hydrolase